MSLRKVEMVTALLILSIPFTNIMVQAQENSENTETLEEQVAKAKLQKEFAEHQRDMQKAQRDIENQELELEKLKAETEESISKSNKARIEAARSLYQSPEEVALPSGEISGGR